MLLLDVTHTSHTRAQTGIQRVVRALAAQLDQSSGLASVCFDPYARRWRKLSAREQDCLRDREGAGSSRGARWSWSQRLAGRVRRWSGSRPPPPAGDALVCPELFSPAVADHLPELFASVRGPRVAIFHDAIALRFPELTPPATVARMPGYLRELLRFDGIAAVSEESAASLRDFWSWLGVPAAPPVVAIPLGSEPGMVATELPASDADHPPVVLCVGTIEGRKNHLALLNAAESLWQAGLRFELHLVGLARPDTAGAALTRLAALQSAGRPVRYDGMISNAALESAYQRCSFSVYPSLAEGFGLPVIESLRHGRPCVCPAGGALGESARGGGCLPLAQLDPPAIAAGLRHLLERPAALAQLATEARARKFRTWRDHAADLTAWMATLPRRP